MKFKIIILFILISVCSCNNTSYDDNDSGDTIVRVSTKKENILVKIAEVNSGDFDLETISNGKLTARQSTDISFPIPGKIKSIKVKNGQNVSKGQVLVMLEESDLKRNVERRREAVEKSKVDLDDRLIDYGYRLRDSAVIPKDIMKMAKIKSGFNTAHHDYADAIASLNKTVIVAPFSGRIVSLNAHEFNSTDGLRFCRLINDTQMDVEFDVLETEYRSISKGTSLEILPFEDGGELLGKVDHVNPSIDNNGMIKITGTVLNNNGLLIDGMSVKVIVKKKIANQIFIPKNAVLDRQDRKVVFTYENGFAKWNYVETYYENSKFVSIRSGLKKGQKVIITNNLNLAHDSKVSLDSDNLKFENPE